ncbi:MAG: hypothetical protein EOO46_23550 [Flavobacterium sp.]|nr:MAG: hypothetical protein EOO46_23550 [Flavobacterium sp.]
MKNLVENFVRRMFAFIALNCSFLCAFYPNIIELFYGPKFQGAAFSGVIMMLYPMHQVYGQLIGGTFYTTGKTKIYSKITITTTVLSIGLSYLFIVKYNLGANGMALKLVVSQFLTVYIINFIFNRSLGVSPLKEIVKDFALLFLLLSFSFSLKYFLGSFNPAKELIFGSLFYSVLCLVSIFLFPKLYGFANQKSVLGLLVRK